MADALDTATRTARELARRTGVERHDVLVILGTGLASVAERLGATGPSIPLATLPFFPRYTATGHHAQGWSVPIGDKMVLVFAGRCHAYEGIELSEVVHPLRTGIAAGCSTVILTAAVGGIRPDLATGSPEPPFSDWPSSPTRRREPPRATPASTASSPPARPPCQRWPRSSGTS